jgi:hypothetical protein
MLKALSHKWLKAFFGHNLLYPAHVSIEDNEEITTVIILINNDHKCIGTIESWRPANGS